MMASEPRHRRPSSDEQRVLGRLVDDLREWRPGQNLTLAYVPRRKAEASWLCAYARAAGFTVALRGIAESHPTELDLRLADEAGAPVVLADGYIGMTADTVYLFGTERASPFELWSRRADVEARIAEAKAALALDRPLVVRTAGGQVRAEILSVEPAAAGLLIVTVANATGCFIADSSIAVNRPMGWDARLSAPVRVELEAGRVVAVSGGSPAQEQFLARAIHVHRAEHVVQVRIGLRQWDVPVSARAGQANAARRGAALRLAVQPGSHYLLASADLRIDLQSDGKVSSGDADRE
jgi:hypothetical protein